MNAITPIDATSATPVLKPDREVLAAFSAAIFKNANPEGFVSLRAFNDGKDAPAIFIEPISVGNPAYLDVVCERARQAAAWPEPVVFCPPVTTFLSGKDAKPENICEGVTLSVDCDASPVAARGELEAILGKPTIAVASGGEWTNPDTGEVERKCHLHWRLKEPTKTPANHALLKDARKLATDLVGGDATGVSLVHPFRWPGSWHRKAQPKLAEIIESNDVEIDLHEALVVLREAAGRRETTADGFAEAATRMQLASNPEHVALALCEIPNKDLSWSDWNNIGLAAWGATGGSEVGFEAFAEWSAKSPKNDPEATRARWEHYKKSPPSSIGFGTLVYLARKSKPGWTADATGAPCKLPYGYSFSDRGLMWKDPDDADKPAMHIAGPFDIEAMTRNGDGNGWGLLLRWKDHDGRDHRFALAHELLAGDGLEARRILTSQGFYIAPNPAARTKFNAFLLQVTSPNRALSTESVGWNGNAFVLPDECIGGDSGETLLLQSATSHDHSFKQSGTLEEWQQLVARLAVGNSRLVFAMSMAFVGPLLGPCSEEGGGVHFKGSSSIGKTTALHAAGSVWGKGGANGYVKSWRATANGLESTCLNHSDIFLCLDEMAQISARDAGEAAYMMANGSGKSRSRTDGSARKISKFRTMFLSSGEIGLADKVAEDNRNKRPTAGQQIRIVDVPADAGAGYGLFEELHGLESGKALSKTIVEATTRVYGTAGRAFLAAIIPEIDDIKRKAAQVTAAFCKQNLPDGADGQVARVAQRFGLIAFAGELAIEKRILPWEAGEAVKAAETCFKAWITERGHTGSAEAHGGIEAVRSFLQMHGMSRFIDAWGEEQQALEHDKWIEITQEAGTRPPPPLRPPLPQRDVCGFRRKVPDDSGYDDYGWEFYINDAGWAEICAGHNPKTLADTLIKIGALVPDRERGGKVRSKTQQRIPGHGKGRYYYIQASFLNMK